jgi:hypothetical protein
VGGRQLSGSALLRLCSGCSLHWQNQGSDFERRGDSLGATLRPARLVLALGPELVGDHAGESFAFLGILARWGFLPLLKLCPKIWATLGPSPQPRDVAEYSGACSFVVVLHAREALTPARSARRQRWEMIPISPR